MGMGEVIENWEYSNFSNKHDVEVFCEKLLKILAIDQQKIFSILDDTRPTHKEMFEMVVPHGKEYLAGNYRGANYPQLVDRPVYVGTVYGDYDSGAKFDIVHEFMEKFHKFIENTLPVLQQKSLSWSPRERIVAYTKFVGACFVNFLAIHPYANGNGHISRLLVWCLFAIKSINCSFWSVPKRNDRPTDKMVTDFRRGDPSALLICFFNLIASENQDVKLH